MDFETKIFVKRDAPQLLRAFLAKKSYRPELIAFSGITDCYQPAERKFQLTRGCLEVACECRQPIGIITKNALVVRDVDLLADLAADRLAGVAVSLTTLDAELAAQMEPRTSTPSARLRAIRELSSAGVPVHVMVAPIIPGLNDSEIPQILTAAKEAGATAASFVMLRLPLSVEPVFLEWLERTQPGKRDRVLNRIRAVRAGELNASQFGSRMRGEGNIAEQIKQMFDVFKKKLGLNQPIAAPNCDLFRRPRASNGQLELF